MKNGLVFFEAVFLLVGTIIGAGYLVLPYSFLKAGWQANLFWLAIFSFFVCLLHLFYAEIVLATGDNHRFPGYVKLYLGSRAERLAQASFLLGIFGSLLVYLLLGARFLGLLIKPIFFLPQSLNVFIFWLLATILVLAKLKLSARINFFITTATLSLFLLLSGLASLRINQVNFSLLPTESLFFPYGLFLYALIGSLVIPEIINFLKVKHQRVELIKPVVIVGTLIPAFIYLFFAWSIFGAIGINTTKEAISGLSLILPGFWVQLGVLLAFLEIVTSYLAFGLNTIQTFIKDFGVSQFVAKGLVTSLPLLLFFVGVSDFVQLIGVLGSVLVTIDSVLVVLMFINLRKKLPGHQYRLVSVPKFLSWLLIVILLIGGVLGLVYSF